MGITGRNRTSSLVAAINATRLEKRRVSEHLGKRCGDDKGSECRQRAEPELTVVLCIHCRVSMPVAAARIARTAVLATTEVLINPA